ncbi:MAG: isoleucine--tRNA ligase [Hyphomonas sp. BRH_c22]|uniref:isoleucine--tRNA ligase n=1 Tax=Hyphomonas sp. BRH_c22 TaxID=1629710 RepID=UPI0005F11FA0|nr:isoleucine--tRNA ligase [Hyphomonas sp. BRH_c22]KJS35610.1 MAG: isoleucine--tRNA ligase [Hyphomonas sp. BRH_c22]KJS39212.1 MAG: isoleucine--tRNA ligase [Hyphomonas sp. BRH_c22]
MTDSLTDRDYRDTLFLPTTDFPMRGGLPQREPEWIKRWDAMKLYDELRADAKARGAKQWILHDGPPYANGHIHLGTAMNKIVKDIIVRSHQMTGHDASYLPGWDCHGLPIEWKVEEEFRAKNRGKDDVPGEEFRAACRAYAEKWVEIQGREFRALGIEGEWDNPYLTMKFESEATIVAEFLRMAMQGALVRGAKPIMWSPVERTALAEAEVEYYDRKVPVIWVKFPVIGIIQRTSGRAEDVAAEQAKSDLVKNASVVIWTTTPWTIPANQAVSFSRDINYGVYQIDEVMTEEELGFPPYAKSGERMLLADDLAESVMRDAKVKSFTRVDQVDPEGLRLLHPLFEMDEFFTHSIPMLAGDHVTADAGTGFVHTAPAHGEDDFNVWVGSGRTTQDIRQIVDADGCYTPDVPRFGGMDIIRTSGKKRGEPGKANQEVITALAESGNLLARGITTIRDAHSWRSKAPVIRRATPQWFISMDKPGPNGKSLRENALKAIDDTEFFPAVGRNRLRSMVEGRPDWLISRQRNWGVPITIFVDKSGQPHTAALPADTAQALNETIKAAIAKGGVEAWFSTPAEDFLSPHGLAAADWDKVTDVLDVWFDSGTTHAFALRERGIIDAETGQADLYMEGSDQHRGWFQSSLLECCATRGIAPYKQVLTHGFIVDSEGKKMSKSIGNTIEPEQIAKQYGIEILRIWTASGDYTEDLRISDEIIKGSVESYRKLRNTVRYMLGALDGYTADEAIAADKMPGLERWVLHRLSELDAQVRAAYKVYDFKKVMSLLINFCGVDLSAVYFDIRKDSLYCDPRFETADAWDEATAAFGNRRRAARTVMAAVLERLLTWLAPVMPFTMEEAFLESHLKDRAASVHLLQFPDTPDGWRDDGLAARWEKIFTVRRVVTGALEVERREKRIGASLESTPRVLVADEALIEAFKGEDAGDLFITSGAELMHSAAGEGGGFTLDDTPGVIVYPVKASGVKCRRSWKYFDPATADTAFPDITPRDALTVKAWDATHD